MKNIIKNLKNSSLFLKMINSFKNKYTQEYIDNEKEHYWEVKCYKNGKYTHTVNIHYFTKEQIEQFQKI